jgi:hypothetical protein
VNNEVMVLAAAVIRGLGPSQQDYIAPTVLELAMNRGELPKATSLMECLRSISSSTAIQSMVSQLNDYLKRGTPARVLSAAHVARRISSPDNLEMMLSALEKSTKGWYKPHNEQIQAEICGYLKDHPDGRATTSLIEILRKDISPEASAAVLALSNKDVVDKLLDLMENSLKEHFLNPNGMSWQTAIGCCRLLPEFDSSLVDFKRLFSMGQLFGWTDSAYSMRKAAVKAGKPVQPLLFDLLKSAGSDQYSFAMTCLDEMGVSIDEISAVFEPPPMVQLIDFFYPNSSPQSLWREKTGLGSTLRQVSVNSFEELVERLLNSFNILTLHVDKGRKAGKPGVDLICLSPVGSRLLVVGVTSGMVKDDLEKLESTVRELKTKLPDLTSRFRVIPLVFTKAESASLTPSQRGYADEKAILVLTSEDIEPLIILSRTGRSAKDFIEFLRKRNAEVMSRQSVPFGAHPLSF